MLFINQFIFLIDVFHLCVKTNFLLYVLPVVTGVIEPATIITTVIHKSRGGIDMNTIAGIIVALLSSFIFIDDYFYHLISRFISFLSFFLSFRGGTGIQRGHSSYRECHEKQGRSVYTSFYTLSLGSQVN
jgi:uncharacterized membrane protein YeaQ/YmgE (transglycosylase-associated protein family)